MHRVILLLCLNLISQFSHAYIEVIIHNGCAGNRTGTERFTACMKKEDEYSQIADRLNEEEEDLKRLRKRLDEQTSTLSAERQALDRDKAELATAKQEIEAGRAGQAEYLIKLADYEAKVIALGERESALVRREAEVQTQKDGNTRQAEDLERREQAFRVEVERHGQAVVLIAADRETLNLLKDQLAQLEGDLGRLKTTLEGKERELLQRERELVAKLATPPPSPTGEWPEKAAMEAELAKLRAEHATLTEFSRLSLDIIHRLVATHNHAAQIKKCNYTINALAFTTALMGGYIIAKVFSGSSPPVSQEKPPEKPAVPIDPVYDYLQSRITMDSTPYSDLLKTEIAPTDATFKTSLQEGKESEWVAKALSIKLYGKLEEKMSFDRRSSNDILNTVSGGGTSTEKAYLLYKWLKTYCDGKQCPPIDLKIGTLNDKGIGVLRTHLAGRDEMPDEKIPRTVGWVTVGEKSYCPSFKYEGATKEFESDFISVDTAKKIGP